MGFPRLFVTDLDATALGGGHLPYARFPDVFSEFLDQLHARGCPWAINTTWHVNAQWDLVRGSRVRSRPCFLMGARGNQLARLENETLVRVEPFTADTQGKIRRFNAETLYPLMKDVFGRFLPETAHFHGDCFSFNALASEADGFIEYIRAAYPEDAGLRCDVAAGSLTARPAFMEKSSNLAEALRLSGIAPEHVVVAGDDLPDIPMMCPELSRYAVCPENAVPQVQAHVRNVGGEVGKGACAEGVLDAFHRLAAQQGWDWPGPRETG